MQDEAQTKPTEASLITARLRQEIVNGTVAPGAKLKLVPLARRYEVSRGPLREAAARLAAEGLVTIEDQRGFRVAPISRVPRVTASSPSSTAIGTCCFRTLPVRGTRMKRCGSRAWRGPPGSSRG